MTTEADRVRIEAIEHINGAVNALMRIVFEEVSGWDEYDYSYSAKLSAALTDLNRIRKELR